MRSFDYPKAPTETGVSVGHMGSDSSYGPKDASRNLPVPHLTTKTRLTANLN